MRTIVAALSSVLLFATACGEDAPPAMVPRSTVPNTPPPKPVTVRFEYRASTDVDEALRRTECGRNVAVNHVHVEWRNFEVTALRAEGAERWTVEFGDVPPGRQRMRLNDINWCNRNIWGAVTGPFIYANGVLLETPALTPGLGDEPGFSFIVDMSGRVRN